MVTRAGLVELRQLGDVRRIFIESAYFTDDDLSEVIQHRKVMHLMISAPQLTDDALAKLSELPELRMLNIGPSDRITDKGLAHLRNLPRLQFLSLGGMHVGNDGLNSLSQIRTLNDLQVFGCQFADSELVHLQKRRRGPRVVITLHGTNVTLQGVDRLKQALPNARINFWPLQPMPGGPELPAESNQRDD